LGQIVQRLCRVRFRHVPYFRGYVTLFHLFDMFFLSLPCMDWNIVLSLRGSHRPPASQIQYEIHLSFYLLFLPSKLVHFLLLVFDALRQCTDLDAGLKLYRHPSSLLTPPLLSISPSLSHRCDELVVADLYSLFASCVTSPPSGGSYHHT
jgi:hypothetical protein